MTNAHTATPIHAALLAALRERGITDREAFRRRYGIPAEHLTAADALTLVTTPAWVTETWLPNSGTTPVVWVPAAVRAYAAVYGIAQREGESDHAFNDRLRREIRAIQRGGTDAR